MTEDKSQDIGLIEKAFLFGVGAASLAKEKAEELAEELIRRGSLTRGEADDFVSKLVVQAKDAGKTAQGSVMRGAEQAISGVGLASAKDIEELRAELTEIKALIATLRPTAPSSTNRDYIP